MKRIVALMLVALCMLLFLVGCGQESTQSDAPSQSTEESGSAPLKVALCLTGPANDGGWCQLVYDGLIASKDQYGIDFSYTENLQTTDM